MDVSAPLLECLDALSRLEGEGVVPTAARIARRLDLDTGTVTERVLALAGLRLVVADDAGRLALTPSGEWLALGLVRKHRLLERFLADRLKLRWEHVHAEACRLTPVLSDEAADALAVLLGAPTHCPHGNPIPAADGSVRAEAGTPLTRVAAGGRATVLRVEREEPDVLRHLAALGILPGTEVAVEEVAPLGGPLLVRVGGARYALGRKVAGRIVVKGP
jgi:DtxR family Mn-dependent transcriptional regulator